MFLKEPVLCERIPTWPWADPAARHIVHYEEFVRRGGYQGLRQAIGMERGEIIDIVKDSMLRGRGGAGFPCGMKWSFLPAPDGGKRYLAINCDEAEPGTFKDRLLVDFDPHLILEGIAIACWACELDTAFFFIRGEYHHQAEVMEAAIQEAYDAKIFGSQGLMDGTVKFAVDCHVHRGAGAYICGEETGLLEAIEGKRGWPRIKPPFPAVKGLFGRPTIVNNVETLAAVPPILQRGVEWWKSIGVESSIGGPPSYGTKLVGVSGHVERPGVYEVGLGVSIRDLVESDDYCKGIRGGRAFKACIPGGVSMGVLGTDQYGAELDFDIGKKYDLMGLGTACPAIFDESTDMVMVARNVARFFKNESCGQCTPCREGAQWLYKLLVRLERGEAMPADLDMILEIAGSMGIIPGTTICGLADGNNWAARTVVNKFREEFESRLLVPA
ncbi:MAG: NADH-quinone oxidoreductase subunit NuoF [Phycisphaerae bacterium]|nr:NADH-quinone oxidoreductase subunit NuoF [Phycisphaerae bacterium]|tara:strand:+ start:675 stop:2000 length:1326 start_codon:yes stop_codon:yes gene_type:complete